MHCRACDDLLSDREATRKSSTTGEYYDLCDRCYKLVMEDLYPESQEQDEIDDITKLFG